MSYIKDVKTYLNYVDKMVLSSPTFVSGAEFSINSVGHLYLSDLFLH